jgi:outer membrane protein TolC
MNRFFSRPRLLACLLLAAGGAWGQGLESRDQLIQRMLHTVLEHNPTLASQAALLREGEKLPSPRGGLALSGVNFSFSTSYLDPDTGAFRLYPAAVMGASLSIADPARALNAYNLRKAREEARQGYLATRNGLIADLLSTVRELLKLAGHRQSLEKLKVYLQDYSDLIEKQVRAGVATPELDKRWELKERLLRIEAESGDVENQLDTMRLAAAMRLAGDSWQELLELLVGLGEK